MSKTHGSEYFIGMDLYKKLLRLQFEAPDIDSFSEKVAARVAYNTPVRSSTMGAMSTTDSTASTLRPASTFDSSTMSR